MAQKTIATLSPNNIHHYLRFRLSTINRLLKMKKSMDNEKAELLVYWVSICQNFTENDPAYIEGNLELSLCMFPALPYQKIREHIHF